MQSIKTVRSWELVTLDLMGPLESTAAGHTHLLTVVDHFTKFLLMIPLKQIRSVDIIAALETHVMCVFGPPAAILTDQGSMFQSKCFEEFCSYWGVDKRRTTAFHPQGNGLNERIHRTLRALLRANLCDNQEWDEIISHLALAYNGSQQASTGVSPHELLFGTPCRLSIDKTLQFPGEDYPTNVPEHLNNLKRNLELIQRLALDNLKKARQKQQKQYDKTSRPLEITVGQYAWLRTPPIGKKQLSPLWTGPYLIVAVNEVTAVIERNGLQYLTHKNRLKKFIGEYEAEASQHGSSYEPGQPPEEEDSPSEDSLSEDSTEEDSTEDEFNGDNPKRGNPDEEKEHRHSLPHMKKAATHPYNLRPRTNLNPPSFFRSHLNL